jgi:hypothetical protein
MEENVKSFLEKIEQIKETTIPVHVASSGKPANSKPLSFKQQKDLISTVADGAVGALKFQRFLNQILIDNVDQKLLRTVDRLPIILQLRVDAIGDIVKVDDVPVSLNEILPRIEKLRFTQTEVVTGDIQVSLEIPLLSEENDIINSCIQHIKSDGDDLGRSIGTIYTYEIVKYVKAIQFGEDYLTFADLPVRDRVKIVENLPISINKKIVSFIQKIKEKETKLLTVQVAGDSRTIELDVRFFDA